MAQRLQSYRAYAERGVRWTNMTLKIEKVSDASGTTLRLIGRMQIEHLHELKTQIELGGPNVSLDVEEMSLVDVEAVRFLGECQAQGVKIIGCAPYIRDWIKSEADPP